MSSGRFTVGIDVGGTWIRLAAITQEGEIRRQIRIPLAEIKRTAEGFAERICRETAAICASDEARVGNHKCDGVGIALPGILDPRRHGLIRSVNLPFLQGVPLRSLLQDCAGVPVVLTTDAQACCRAEFEAYGLPVSCFVHLRFGTGIGCAVAKLGRVELLERQGTHHPHLLVVERGADALLCRCGAKGCLETIASGWAIPTIDTDRAARGSIQAIVNLAARYQPEVICTGGGLLQHQPAFAHKLRELYAAQCREMERLPRLIDSRLGDDAGVVGAARAALSLT